MFAIASKRLFWWPVTVKIPHPEKAGEFQEHGFEAQFEALPIDRAKDLDEARSRLPVKDQAAHSFDFLFEVVRGWRDVVDADGEAVAFSREIFEAQLNYVWFRTAILSAYEQAVTGQEARLGN